MRALWRAASVLVSHRSAAGELTATAPDAERQQDQRYFKLVRDVVGDCVSSFHSGKE
jgi:hypothetical protein